MQAPHIRFTPVEFKARHDGWTSARQRHFIEELAATKSIARACRAVGMSRMSAYKLRDHPDAAQFRRAWEKALEPDFVAKRRRSPRALQRLGRLEKRRKVYEAHETDEPPNSLAAAPVDFVTFDDFGNLPGPVARAGSSRAGLPGER